jgi:hypothetical protein
MKALTQEGQQLLNEIAARYDLKPESVTSLVHSIVLGNGTMAQFDVPELGGDGQWMKGGMTMVGDMFNHGLKAKVDQLCTEISELITTKVIFEEQDDTNRAGVTRSSGTSWPPAFGSPTSSGAQNNIRYAYFAPAKRLVIEVDGNQRIYDTKHHVISGVSQQQGSGSSIRFTSQDGPVELEQLSLVSEPGSPSQELPEIPYDVVNSNSASSASKDDIFQTIEKINILFEKGIITMEEFQDKKRELLSRL